MNSPNAASAAKLEEAQVNLSAGTLNLGIPLYTLEEQNLQVPISLSYTNGSGVKPDEHPGWTGMGWNLQAGGVITRVVKGNSPDEFAQTLYMNIAAGGNNIQEESVPIGYAYYTNFLKSANWNTNSFVVNLLNDEYDEDHNVVFEIDTEPDMFYLSYPGFSGKMYLTHESTVEPGDATKYYIRGIRVEGNPLITVEAEVKAGFSWFYVNSLLHSPNGQDIDAMIKATKSIITGFLVKTPDGNKYKFGSYGTTTIDPTKIELTDNFHQQTIYSGFTNTWHLAEIKTPNDEETITFTYEKKDFTISLTHNFQYEKTSGQSPSGLFPFFNTTVGATSSTSTSKVGASMTFTSYLKKISSNYYEIDFTTSASSELVAPYASMVAGSWPDVIMDGNYGYLGFADNTSAPNISDFNLYYDSNLAIDSYTPDANNNNIPDQTPAFWPSDGRDGILDFNNTGFILLPNLNVIYKERIDVNRLKWYKLDKITVKNKSSNTVLRSFIFSYDNTSSERLRLQSVTEKGENETTDVKPATSFIYESTPLPGYVSNKVDHWGYYNGVTADLPDPNTSNWATENTNYVNSRAPNAAFVQAGILKTVNYPNGASVTFDYEINKYKKVVKRAVSGGAFSVQTNATETNGGGVRIKTITTNPGSGQPSVVKNYTYANGTLGGEFQYYWPAFQIKLISNPNATVSRERFITQTTLPVTVNSSGNPIYYTNVTETLSGHGKTEYTFTDFDSNPDDNFETSVNVNHSAYAAFSSRAMERGLVKNVKVYNSSNVLEKEDIYTYERQGSFFARAIENSLPKVLGGYERIGSSYKVHLYPYKVKTLTTRTYLTGSANPVTTLKTYTYNSCALLQSETMVNSDNKTYVTSYKYACDEEPPPAPVYDDYQCYLDYEACNLNCAGEPDPVVRYYCYQSCNDAYFQCQDNTYAAYQAALAAWQAQYGAQYANYMNFREKNMLGTLLETKTVEGANQIGQQTTYKKGWGACTTCLFPERFLELEGSTWVEQSKVTEYETSSGLPKKLVKRYNDGTYSANYEFTWTNRRLTQKTFIGRTWSYDYAFTKSRQVTKITDFDGQITNFGYDGFQRLDWSNGRNNNISNDFNYQIGSINKLIEINNFSDFPAQNTETKFDGLGRPVETKRIGYTYNNTDFVSTATYNARGWISQECDPSKGGCKTFNYYPSPLGRLRYAIPHGGGATIWYYYETNAANEVLGYGANTLFKTKVKDENGNFTSTYTDYLGRTVMVRRQINSTTFSDTYYTYDIRGNVTQIKAPNNLNYTYTYYSNGQLWQKTVPDAGTVTYTYDIRDRLIKTQDANGNIVENTLFDDYDQVKEVKQNGTVIKTYDYYTTNSAGASDKGKLKSSVIKVLGTTNNITTTYNYDLFGRLIKTTANNILGGQDIYDYTYNHADKTLTKQRKHTTVISGVTNTYDIAEKFDYDHGGRNIRNFFNLGTTPTHKINELVYNNNDWLIQRKVGHYAGSNSWLQEMDYTYTSRGWLNTINQFQTASTSIVNCTPGPIVYPCEPPNCYSEIQAPEMAESCLESISNQMFTIDYDKEKLQDPTAPSLVNVKFEGDFTYVNGKIVHEERFFTFKRNEYPAEVDAQPIEEKFTHTEIVSLPAYKVDADNKGQIGEEIKGELVDQLKSMEIHEEVLNWLTSAIESATAPAYSECANCLQAPPPTDIFAMQINYTAGNSLLNAPAQYNGNISNVIWQVHTREKQAYGFTYDPLNRMTAAYYADIRNDNGYTTDNKFGENVTYFDHAGNIQNITRRGITSTGSNCNNFNTIDQLTLTTTSNSNKVSSVSEASSITKGFLGTGGSYTYDANGNVKTNTSKNITNITYNYLNLPTQISIGTTQRIDILYDADGRKLRKQTFTKSGSLWLLSTERHYFNGIEYYRSSPFNTSKIEAIYHSDGRIAYQSNGTSRYEYALRDHLGSMRVQFSDLNNDGVINGSTEILQEGEYYPFGMNIECPNFNYNNATYTTDKYQFNNKELNTDFNLNLSDYGARWYDASIGRWWSVDPLADKTPGWSTYAYTLNNPILMIDPDGRLPIIPVILGVWAVVEIGLTAYDVYDAGKTLADPNASTTKKATSVGGALLGVVVPGGGYSYADDLAEGGIKIIDNYADEVVEQSMRRSGDARKAAMRDIAQESTARAQRGGNGVIGEQRLLSMYGGKSQVVKYTASGEKRVIDVLSKGVAYESKVGYMSLTDDIARQIQKDKDLLADPTSGVKKVVWTFFESPTTGKAGASNQLLEALKDAGIETQIVRN